MILIHVDPLTFKYGAQTMIFWSRALLRLFLQCFFKMAVLYCLNDNLSSKMNFQHFNINKLHMQTQKKQIQDKKNGRNCPVSGAWWWGGVGWGGMILGKYSAYSVVINF